MRKFIHIPPNCRLFRRATPEEEVRAGVWNDPPYEVRGVWFLSEPGIDGKRHPLICCPKCGHLGDLSKHTIDVVGNVSPSVLHNPGVCDYHEVGVVLEGWQG